MPAIPIGILSSHKRNISMPDCNINYKILQANINHNNNKDHNAYYNNLDNLSTDKTLEHES